MQYQPSTQTWRFAPQQYDAIRLGNERSAGEWLDLFVWGSSSEGSYDPTAYNVTPTGRSWYEWGQNVIGNHPANTWRTLSGEEWEYLLVTRQVNGGAGYSVVRLQYGNTTRDTISGLILYPDNFKWSDADIADEDIIGVGGGNFSEVKASKWAALEKAGCVFLPMAGVRSNAGVFRDGTLGLRAMYWSSTPSGTSSAEVLGIESSAYKAIEGTFTSCAVRLVKNY